MTDPQDAHGSSTRFALGGWRTGAVLALVLAATAAAYSPALRGEFVFDDRSSFVDQVATKDLASFVRSSFIPALARGGTARPVTELTYAVNYALSGLDPWTYHLVSLGIHLLTVLLVFAFTRELLVRAGWREPGNVALAVAGIFALHPLQSQAVAYISQRSESLASAFYLAALLLLFRAERRLRSPSGAALYVAATAAFVAGLGTKVIVLTLPLAYVAVHAWFPEAPPGRERRRGLLLAAARVLPWVAIGAASALATLRGVEGKNDVGFSIPALSPATYLVTQGRVVLRYLGLLFLPVGQNVDPHVTPSGPRDVAALASGAALLALAGCAVYLWRRAARGRMSLDGAAAARVASFGVLWFFLLLAPSSSIVPLVDLMMEHRVYLASWGVFAAALIGGALALDRLLPARASASVAAAATACAWIALGAALHARTPVWSSAVALWSDVVTKSPAKPRGYVNLGVAYLATGDAARAATVQERALALTPNDPVLLNSVAILLLEQGRLAEAEERARRAVAADRADGAGYNTLGELALKRGDAGAAVELFREAVRRRGQGVTARVFNLALALERAGQEAEACRTWAQYLRIEGNRADRLEVQEHAASRGCALP